MFVAGAGATIRGADVNLTGTLVTVHADGFSHGRSTVNSRLETSSGTYDLQFTGGPPDLPHGNHVNVHGLQSGNTITVAANGVTSGGGTSSTGTPVTGTRKLAIILFTFADNTVQPYTPAFAQGIAFTNPDSVSVYYNEVSHGQLQITGSVFGWYKLADTSATCNYTQWATDANAAATAAGVNLSGYTNITYAFPDVAACWWDGLSMMPGTQAWLDGPNGMTLHVLAHELGHNFGTHHANSYWCSVNGVRVPLSTAANCSSSEYGDPFSVMGSGTGRQHTNFSRAQFGWLGSGQVKDVTATGTYALDPIEPLDTAGVQALRIKRDASNYLLLEYRRPYGTYFDNFSSTDPAVTGVTIRLVQDWGMLMQSQLVDATPATATYDDAALSVGQSLSDPVSGVAITTTAAGAAGATVRITIPDAVPPSAPTSPSASATDATHVKLSWTASTDNVGVTGYQIFRGGTLLTTTSTVGYTDATVSPATTYSYYVKAVDAAGNASAASNTVSATTPKLDTTPPSAPTLTATKKLSSGVYTAALSWTASTDNVGVAGYRVYRNGLLLATVATRSYTDSKPPTGSDTYSVSSYDAAGNTTSSKTVSLTF